MWKKHGYGYLNIITILMNQTIASQSHLHMDDFLSYGVFQEGVERLLLLWKVGIEFLTRPWLEEKVHQFNSQTFTGSPLKNYVFSVEYSFNIQINALGRGNAAHRGNAGTNSLVP